MRSDPYGHNQLQRVPSVARRVESKQTVRRESVTGEKPSGFRDVRVVLVRFSVDRVFLPRLHGDDGTQVRGAGRLHHLDADTADQQPLDRTSVHLLVFAGRAHALQRPEDVPRPSEIHAGRFRPGVFGTVFLRAGTDGLHGQVFPVQKPRIQAVHRRHVGQRVADAGERRRERRGPEAVLAGRRRNRRIALAGAQTVARREYTDTEIGKSPILVWFRVRIINTISFLKIQGLRRYVESADDGVIFISFGTYVHPCKFPKHSLDAFISVVGELKQKVLWRWGCPGATPDLPAGNVMFDKWFPQFDILSRYCDTISIVRHSIVGCDRRPRIIIGNIITTDRPSEC